MSEREGTIHIELTADDEVFTTLGDMISDLVYGDTLAPGGLDAIVSCHVDGSCDESPHCTGGQVKEAADRHAALVARVEALAGDLWRVTTCGCGHRADLHHESAGCIGGLALCACRQSFSSIAQERIRDTITDDDRAALDAVREAVWDEGYDAGLDYMTVGVIGEPEPDNPYRRQG